MDGDGMIVENVGWKGVMFKTLMIGFLVIGVL
jgi:hypothetical protein